jgi:lipoprotein-releasing system permease protein
MFHPLSVYVGLRYVRARSTKFFVSFITWASLVGVCVGVAALIVILSVMNGFERELRERLLSLSAQVRINPLAAPGSAGAVLSDAQWQAARRVAAATAGVVDVEPYAELQALAVRQPEMLPVLLRGIDPTPASAAELTHAMTQGRLGDLTPGSGRVLVGEVIAERLGLSPGDSVTLLVPVVGQDGMPQPRLRDFTVAGEFEAGLPDHDATLVLAPLADVRALVPAGAATEGLRLRLRDVLAAPAVAARLRARLPHGLEVRDWTQDNASYFRAIRIEKTMMGLILMLIVAVAIFNIVATLVMVVNDKRTDIAILRTLGMTPRGILAVFMTQGVLIGWLGTAIGVAAGVALALNVDVVVPFLEHLLHVHIMDDPDVYYISGLPSETHAADVVLIAAAAMLLTLLATIYPAWQAAKTQPAEALRYE